ncbi:MAG: hypothetical protein ISS57_12085 [Anaerolineales bacterium]|nr:hypothetical protein [Anaerolineales bacterium]
MRRHFALLVLLLVSACGTFDYAPLSPTPEHISVIHTPAIGWIKDTLHQCAVDHPEIALTVEEWPAAALDPGAADVIIKLGTPPEDFASDATLLGWEQIVIIAHPNIPASQLELPDLQNIYTSLDPVYQAWTYPETSPLRSTFDEVVLNGTAPSPHTKIAPSPIAMLESMQTDSSAVGYIPQSWIAEGDIQVIPMNDEIKSALRQPIIALTNDEPDGVARELLACLTNLISQSGNSQ